MKTIAVMSDHGKYVYYSGKGAKSVQWREMAFDLCKDREELAAMVRAMLPEIAAGVNGELVHGQAIALLAKLDKQA